MISKKSYFKAMSTLQKHELPPSFEEKIMRELNIKKPLNKTSKLFYATTCTVLSVFLTIMILSSPPATKTTYIKLGENAKTISMQVSTSIQNILNSRR